MSDELDNLIKAGDIKSYSLDGAELKLEFTSGNTLIVTLDEGACTGCGSYLQVSGKVNPKRATSYAGLKAIEPEPFNESD